MQNQQCEVTWDDLSIQIQGNNTFWEQLAVGLAETLLNQLQDSGICEHLVPQARLLREITKAWSQYPTDRLGLEPNNLFSITSALRLLQRNALKQSSGHSDDPYAVILAPGNQLTDYVEHLEPQPV